MCPLIHWVRRSRLRTKALRTTQTEQPVQLIQSAGTQVAKKFADKFLPFPVSIALLVCSVQRNTQKRRATAPGTQQFHGGSVSPRVLGSTTPSTRRGGGARVV